MTPPSPSLQKTIAEATDRFVEEMTGLIKVAARDQLIAALGVEGFGVPQLPMPKRKSRYLAPPQTKKRKSLKALSEPMQAAYKRLKKSKRPVTVTSASKLLKMSESNARYVLSKLLQTKMASTESLGDGTSRKVYLLGK